MVVATAIAAGAVDWTRQTNSDNFAWQRLLDIWLGQGHGHAWISEDLFPTRFPLYLLLDALGLVGRRGVFVASVVLNIGGATAFVGGLLASGDITRPVRTRVLVALGITAIWAPLTWDQVFADPNTRSLELGLAVLAIAWVSRVITPTDIATRRLAIVAAVLGALWLSDPFVLYLFGIPAAIVALIDLRDATRRRPSIVLLGLIGSSALLAALLRRALTLVNVTAVPVANGARHITAIGDLPDRAKLVLEHLATLLGFGSGALTHGSIDDLGLAWLRLTVVVLAAVGAALTLRNWDRATLLARTLVVAFVADVALVTGTNVFADPAHVVDRYLSVALIAVIGLAIIAVEQLPLPAANVAAAVVATLIAGVVITSVHTWWTDRHVAPDGAAVALDAAVDHAGWDRVYGNYFEAIRDDQLGGAGPRWVTVECDPGGALRLMHFNNDTAVTSGRPRVIAVAPLGLACSVADLRAAYGPPTLHTKIGGVPFVVWEHPPERLRNLR
jgi:hypothetical protein